MKKLKPITDVKVKVVKEKVVKEKTLKDKLSEEFWEYDSVLACLLFIWVRWVYLCKYSVATWLSLVWFWWVLFIVVWEYTKKFQKYRMLRTVIILLAMAVFLSIIMNAEIH